MIMPSNPHNSGPHNASPHKAETMADLSRILNLPDRAEALSGLKQWWQTGLDNLEQQFRSSAPHGDQAGQDYALGHGELVYQLLTALFTHECLDCDQQVALVATGGTGRQEMCPGSDIDIMLLFEGEPDAPATERFLYWCWDLGLKIGHAVRSLKEARAAAKSDQTILTTLLEARLVAGDQSLFFALTADLGKLLDRDLKGWMAAKMAERNKRHEAAGGSRYLVTPNVKEGKGGLRDLHMLFWLMKASHRVTSTAEMVDLGVLRASEETQFLSAWRFLLKVRVALHLAVGRGEDRLGFEHQPIVAEMLGYDSDDAMPGTERFMRDYFGTARQVGGLTRIFCTALALSEFAKWQKVATVEGFSIRAGRLALGAPNQLEEEPAERIRLFRVAQRHQLDIHPETLKSLSRLPDLAPPDLQHDPHANDLFVLMLTDPEHDPELALRLFAESGMMGAFIPDFGRVEALMQWDMYHHYTVDEHTLRAIGLLHALEQGRLDGTHRLPAMLIRKIQSRRALYVALLLHDIAKGRGGKHEVLGADVAAELCPRLGLDEDETETVLWAVRWHLLMSDTAFKRDLNDPRTVSDFAEEIQSVQRLHLLTVLTAIDITAVGPGTWTEWKAALLEQLHAITELTLTGGVATEAIDSRAADMRDAARALLPHWPSEQFEDYAARVPPGLWLAFEPVEQAEIARLVDLSRRENRHLSVEYRQNARTGLTDVIVHTADRLGLFADLVAAIGAARLSTVQARIFTLEDQTVLDVFSVCTQGGGPVTDPARLSRLSGLIQHMVDGGSADETGLYSARRPTAQQKAMRVPARVMIDNTASARFTVIEINAKDRPGLLHDISRVLVEDSLTLHSAKIATYGAKAIDSFYVQDIFGTKLTQPHKLDRLKQRLTDAIQPPSGWQ
ncbi:MAG: [protein-PII] uridylyltransferase [Alphaproteobacteria bacterium]